MTSNENQTDLEEKLKAVYAHLVEADTNTDVEHHNKHSKVYNKGSGIAYITQKELAIYLDKSIDASKLPDGVTVEGLAKDIFHKLNNKWGFEHSGGITLSASENGYKADRVNGGVDRIEDVLMKEENKQLLYFLASMNPRDVPAGGFTQAVQNHIGPESGKKGK